MLNGSNAERRKGYERHPLYFHLRQKMPRFITANQARCPLGSRLTGQRLFSHWSEQTDPVLLVAPQDPPSLPPPGILGPVNELLSSLDIFGMPTTQLSAQSTPAQLWGSCRPLLVGPLAWSMSPIGNSTVKPGLKQ